MMARFAGHFHRFFVRPCEIKSVSRDNGGILPCGGRLMKMSCGRVKNAIAAQAIVLYVSQNQIYGKEAMDGLKGSQRKYLRAQAHHLKPLVIIGAKGVTQQLLGSVDLALKDHELIKVKFGEFKESKKELSEEIADRTKSEHIGLIGNVAIFYRPHPEPEKRKIKLP